MNHLTLLYFISVLFIGSSALIFVSIIYLKTKNFLLGEYLFSQTIFTFKILFDVVFTYVRLNLDSPQLLEVLSYISLLPPNLLFLIAVPRFIHNLVGLIAVGACVEYKTLVAGASSNHIAISHASGYRYKSARTRNIIFALFAIVNLIFIDILVVWKAKK
jgi:hypothetical protein